MSTPTNAVTLSVLLLLSHLFLSSHSLQDPSSTVAVSATGSGSESESEPSTAVDSKDEPYQTVVFHPSQSDGPVDPDLIAHSFRLPSHRHQHHHFHHGVRCGGGGGHRRPIGDGTIRLPSMQRGFGGGRGPFVEIAAEDFEQQMKRARKEKKWMKKERKDDDDDSDSDDDEEFEHEKKRMKRPRREGTWGFMDRVRHFLNHF